MFVDTKGIGIDGEVYILTKILKALKQKNEWFMAYYNVKLPSFFGETQIDALIVTTRGVFVIEIKNYSGDIFGIDTSEKWFHNDKKNFRNPLLQNAFHVDSFVKKVIYNGPIFNCVVFTDFASSLNIVYQKQIKVFKIDDLINYIFEQEKNVLNTKEQYRIQKRLESFGNHLLCTMYGPSEWIKTALPSIGEYFKF